MFANEILYKAHLERYKDLVREADKARLLSQMPTGQGRRNRFYLRVLTWLGRRLVVWGRRLMERYGAEPQPLRSGP